MSDWQKVRLARGRQRRGRWRQGSTVQFSAGTGVGSRLEAVTSGSVTVSLQAALRCCQLATLLRHYCGTTAALLRHYCGTTAAPLRHYCGTAVKTYTGGAEQHYFLLKRETASGKREVEAPPSSLRLNSKTIYLLTDDAKETHLR
jgi:hypothetical protein